MLSFKEPPLQERSENPNSLFQDVKNLFVEYGLASGGLMPSRGNLAALHRHGYLSLSPAEALKACQCDDYDELAELMRPWYEDEVASRQAEESAILLEIEQARVDKLVPEILFKKILKQKSPERQAIIDSGGKDKNDIGLITEEEVSPLEKIERYKKYQLVQRLLADVETNETSTSWTERRKLGIVLGLYLDDSLAQGKLQERSFTKELCKANASIDDGFVEFEAGNDFDYIFPQVVREGCDQLLSSANDKEYFYDKIDKVALVGKLAVKEYKEASGRQKGITKLGELLVKKSVDINIAFKNRAKYRHWEREDFIDYGYWLLEMLTPGHKLDLAVLTRASQLGIGPGPTVIRGAFNGLANFYQQLPMEGSHHGLFADWSFKDYVVHVAKIAAENGGKVSREIIEQRIADGAVEPSFSHICREAGPLEVLLPAASLEPPANTKMTRQQCLEIGLRYANEHGVPSYADIEASPDLPSETPIRRCFGTTAEYQRLLRAILDARAQIDALPLELAA
ncbi:MAG TPA: hypothetical protein VFP35_04230 [Candidatus Saccharimonadales bacterium]|nr:hypothetical protein [Candidatus Saccharimonadales bacterium]